MIDKALHFFVFTQKTKEEKYPIVEINRDNLRVLDVYDEYTDMCTFAVESSLLPAWLGMEIAN